MILPGKILWPSDSDDSWTHRWEYSISFPPPAPMCHHSVSKRCFFMAVRWITAPGMALIQNRTRILSTGRLGATYLWQTVSESTGPSFQTTGSRWGGAKWGGIWYIWSPSWESGGGDLRIREMDVLKAVSEMEPASTKLDHLLSHSSCQTTVLVCLSQQGQKFLQNRRAGSWIINIGSIDEDSTQQRPFQQNSNDQDQASFIAVPKQTRTSEGRREGSGFNGWRKHQDHPYQAYRGSLQVQSWHPPGFLLYFQTHIFTQWGEEMDTILNLSKIAKGWAKNLNLEDRGWAHPTSASLKCCCLKGLLHTDRTAWPLNIYFWVFLLGS